LNNAALNDSFKIKSIPHKLKQPVYVIHRHIVFNVPELFQREIGKKLCNNGDAKQDRKNFQMPGVMQPETNQAAQE